MSNSRIGILTFHQAMNYGAILQTYSLSNIVAKNGFDVSIIDYHCEKIYKAYHISLTKRDTSWKAYIIKNIQSVFHLRRNSVFFRFRNHYLKLSCPYDKTNIANANTEYDYVIVGSDQVWNPSNTNKDVNYLLEFSDATTKRIAYAPSLAAPQNFVQFGESAIHDNLSKFKAISCREMEGCKEIKKNGFKCDLVLDPVFLTSKEEWRELTNRISKKNQKFIFLYTVRMTPDILLYAKRVSEEQNAPVIATNILLKSDLCGCKLGFKIRSNISPEEFLWYIDNAMYVITDSFHCTALSILFRKKFCTEKDLRDVNNTNSRLQSMFSQLGLLDRFIDFSRTDNLYKTIDYDTVEEILAGEREKSEAYLKEALDMKD